MSDESLFRSGLLVVKELLRWPWRSRTAADRIEPLSSGDSTEQLCDIAQDPQVPQFTWLGGGTVLLQLGLRRVLVDPVAPHRPWWRGGSRGRGWKPAWKGVEPLDVIVLTHRARMDSRLLQSTSKKTPVVVPTGLGRDICRQGFDQVIELAAGEQFASGDLDVTALPTPFVFGRRLRSAWGVNVATWGGLSVQLAGKCPQDATGQTFWFLRHSREHQRGLERLAGLGARPDVVLVLLDDQKAVWLTGRQGMMPEMAVETFRSVGGRVFVPLGAVSTQDASGRETLVTRIRSLWEARKPPGSTLLLPQFGEAVAVPVHR